MPESPQNIGVINNMELNLTELREYYVISKQQAKSAFNTSLIVCILGFLVFLAGVIVTMLTDADVILYTTISGGLVEIISGLFFTVYNGSIKQLNVYHKRLGVTEKYLTAIQVCSKLPDEIKTKSFSAIIDRIMDDAKYSNEKDAI